MSTWLIIIAGGVLTYLTRLSFIWLFGRMRMPGLLVRALRFVPPAVLAVIIFQEVLIRDGSLALRPDNARLLAGVFATLVAWRTRSALLTIALGMGMFLVLHQVLQ